jgi:AraC-like DNA-binding protein
MVNIAEFKHVLDLFDRDASPRIVDHALRAEGLNRDALREANGFLPYASEARVVEQVARSIGDRALGARIAQEFDYSIYDAYARYVLGGTTLAAALARGKSAFHVLHAGSEIVLREQDGHLLVGRRSGIETVVGHRHLDDAAIVIIVRLCRQFLGPDWRPAWIEMTGDSVPSARYLEELIGVPVHIGSEMPAVAVPEKDLEADNPHRPNANQIVGLRELPALMGLRPPRTMADSVEEVLRTQLVLGDLSEDGVAHRLSVGRRTLQRTLHEEGTSFREVKARFIEAKARLLLAESDLDLATIAHVLGYEEPKSFYRAFRKWTGYWPAAYRGASREW